MLIFSKLLLLFKKNKDKFIAFSKKSSPIEGEKYKQLPTQ